MHCMPQISSYALKHPSLGSTEPQSHAYHQFSGYIHRYKLLRPNVNSEVYLKMALLPPIYPLNPSSAFMDADTA